MLLESHVTCPSCRPVLAAFRAAPRLPPARAPSPPQPGAPSLCPRSPPAQAPLFSGLPKPAQKKKVVVQFKVPISYDPADVKSNLEEEVGDRCACLVLLCAAVSARPFVVVQLRLVVAIL